MATMDIHDALLMAGLDARYEYKERCRAIDAWDAAATRAAKQALALERSRAWDSFRHALRASRDSALERPPGATFDIADDIFWSSMGRLLIVEVEQPPECAQSGWAMEEHGMASFPLGAKEFGRHAWRRYVFAVRSARAKAAQMRRDLDRWLLNEAAAKSLQST